MRYDAFISYRHVERDAHIAENLQKLLEHYRIPGKIRRKTGKKKIDRIFRDREELPISDNLGKTIQEALRESEYLIVICSPESKQSDWVRREVAYFLETHRQEKVLTVLTKGEPVDALPEVLLHDQAGKPIEPLAADVRGGTKKERLRKLKEEKLRLLAALLSCPYDSLKQREREYRMRRGWIGMSAALLLALGFSGYAVRKNILIQKEYEEKLISESRYLAKTSEELLAGGDRIRAIQVALGALPESEADSSRPLVYDAVYALNNALYSYQNQTPLLSIQSDRVLEMEYQIRDPQNTEILKSPSEAYAACIDEGNVLYIYDVEKEECVKQIQTEELLGTGAVLRTGCFLSEEEIILYTKNGIACVNFQTDEIVWEKELGEAAFSSLGANRIQIEVTKDQSQIAICENTAVVIYDAKTGEIRQQADFSELEEQSVLCTDISFNPDMTKAVFGFGHYKETAETAPVLQVMDLESGEVHSVPTGQNSVFAVQFLDSDRIATIEYQFKSSIEMYSTDVIWYETVYDSVTDKKVWSLENREQIDIYGKAFLEQAAVETKGEAGQLISALGRTILVVNEETGAVLIRENGSAQVQGIAQTEEGELVLGLQDGAIYSRSISRDAAMQKIGGITGSVVSDFLYCVKQGAAIQAKEHTNQLVVSTLQNDPEIALLETGETGGSFGYIETPEGENYRYVRNNRYQAEDSGQTAQLVLWKPGEKEPLVSLKEEEGVCIFPAFTVAKEGDDTILYYTRQGETEYQLKAYSISAEKELWEMNLMREGERASSNRQVFFFRSDGAEQALVCRSDAFDIYDLSTRAKKKTVTDLAGDGRYGSIYQVQGSEDGAFLAFAYSVLGTTEYRLRIWNTQEGTWQGEYPLQSYDTFAIGTKENLLAVYSGEELQVINLETREVEETIPFSGKNSCRFAFMAEDERLLLWGDSGHLSMWDRKEQKVIMEERESYQHLQMIAGDASGEYFQVQEGIENGGYVLSSDTMIYRLMEDGTFTRYAKIHAGAALPSEDEVICIQDNGENLGVFPFYTLDDLLKKAYEIVGDQELTETEKIRYYMKN